MPKLENFSFILVFHKPTTQIKLVNLEHENILLFKIGERFRVQLNHHPKTQIMYVTEIIISSRYSVFQKPKSTFDQGTPQVPKRVRPPKDS